MSEPRKIAKEKFTFVQREGKIFDKEFETKPVGYFQDAMSRFAKNKTNVIASGILFTIIIFSIFQPLITDKNYVNQESSIAFLPPRIPILENFGIADGNVFFENQPIDLTTIDPGFPTKTLVGEYAVKKGRVTVKFPNKHGITLDTNIQVEYTGNIFSPIDGEVHNAVVVSIPDPRSIRFRYPGF
jgi:hypothetical protein